MAGHAGERAVGGGEREGGAWRLARGAFVLPGAPRSPGAAGARCVWPLAMQAPDPGQQAGRMVALGPLSRLARAGLSAQRATPPTTPQAGIDKLIRILEGEPGESQFNAEQYMRLYT